MKLGNEQDDVKKKHNSDSMHNFLLENHIIIVMIFTDQMRNSLKKTVILEWLDS